MADELDAKLRAAADPACPRCKGRGYTASPYMVGLPDGNLSTITLCACLTREPQHEDPTHG